VVPLACSCRISFAEPAMPQSTPRGLTRDHVLRALSDLDAGADHPFGAPTGYELIHEGRRYAPKAVVGLACLYLLGRPLRPDEFKRANVSAVLAGQGLPYVDGYKPRGNYQEMLAEEVDAFLDQNPAFLEQLAVAPTVDPPAAPAVPALDLDAVIEDPPEKMPA